MPTVHIQFVCSCRFPIALDVVFYQKRIFSFLLWCAISFVTIAVSLSSPLLPLLPLTISFPPSFPLPSPSHICSLSKIPLLAVDSLYYGRLVLAPWNIIMYNVFGKGGPTLYGKISLLCNFFPLPLAFLDLKSSQVESVVVIRYIHAISVLYGPSHGYNIPA